MKHVLKRMLALLVALMLVIPSLAFADEEVVTDPVDGIYEQEVCDLGEEAADSPAEAAALSAAESVEEIPDAGEETPDAEEEPDEEATDAEATDVEAESEESEESAETSDVAVELVDEEFIATETFAEEIDGIWSVSADPAFSAEVEPISASNAVLFAPSDTDVAEINGTGYATLADAVAAAGAGDTITLLANVTEHTFIPSGKDIKLDLNGKTLTDKAGVLVRGKLTVDDGGTGGKIVSQDVGIWVNNGGELIFNSGAVEAQEMAMVLENAGKCTINNGTFTAKDNAVLGTNGTSGHGGNSITINNGTFNGTIQTSGYVACGIYAPNDDTWKINGGTFNITGGAGIVVRAGTVTVGKDVVINTTGETTGKVGDSRVVVPCAAIVFDTEANYPGLKSDSVIEINGGTFNSDIDPVKVVGNEDSRIQIYGGIFTPNMGDESVAEGYIRIDNKDGTFTVRKPIVTFDLDGGEDTGNYEDQEVSKGSEATEPDEPNKTGYTFDGWYADGEDEAFDFATPIDKDITLTAQWKINQYTLTFADTGDAAIDPVTYDYGEAIVAPKDPTRAGYTFAGWNPALPATMPDKDLTVTAKWTAVAAQTPQPHAPVKGVLVATMRSSGKNSLKLTWTAVSNVEGYDIFINRCNTGSKKFELEKVASVPAGSARAYVAKNLKKHTFYKATVKAYYTENGAKVYAANSPLVHAATAKFSGSQCNPKAVKVGKSKLSLKAGKTKKLKVSVTKTVGRKKLMKNHAAKVRYISSDTSVATVSAKGKVKGVAKGTCNIYCIAANGVYKTVKVTVK